MLNKFGLLQMNYQNKQMLLGAMIIAGWDREGGGQVYGCPIGGTLLEEPWTTDGSGSTYIWGYLDSAFRSVLLWYLAYLHYVRVHPFCPALAAGHA